MTAVAAGVSRGRAWDPRVTVVHVVLGLAWLAAVGAGSALLWRYKSTPGASYPAPPVWPSDTAILRSATRPTLVMFAHPKCPCTRASIGELAVVMSQASGEVDAHVLFDQPASVAGDWTRTDLWRSASAIPGVSVSVDRGGEEARRFQVSTSGFTVLYGRDGRLLFAGGITSARGHAGDSEGRSAVLALLTQGASSRAGAPVFGCELDDPERAAPSGR